MLTSLQTSDIAHVVQLATAPVFLLTGVGAILSVLTTRMGRVIDRAHRIEGWIEDGKNPAHYAQELAVLGRRLNIIHHALALCSVSIFFVCSVIFTIFVGAYLDVLIGGTVALLFALAMLMLIGAVALFMVEIQLARRSIVIGPRSKP